MSEITEIEINSMTKEQNYMRGYEDGKSDVLDKIRAEIEARRMGDCLNVCVKAWNEAIEKVLDIIDKYKAESEES